MFERVGVGPFGTIQVSMLACLERKIDQGLITPGSTFGSWKG